MIVLFTDYGIEGPYIGQVQAVLLQSAPGTGIINLFLDAPRQNPMASAYLLSACSGGFPEGTIFFCVVDPGVGSDADKPVVLKIDGNWFVGPDNGLFDLVIRRSKQVECWKIAWRPERLSSSFYGRDLYAPVCAGLANGAGPPGDKIEWQDQHDWPDDIPEIIYFDHFGNAMTGMRAGKLDKGSVINIAGNTINNAVTFAEVPAGQVFWYENSNGLVEIAVNQGSAQDVLQLHIGDLVSQL
ncbi:MAG: S-adenosyl-l-methionine hydroxide adenosyltransferase family protein [Gammaproteobacteria bacterium]